MGKAMTKSAIVSHLATKVGLAKQPVAAVLDELATLAYAEAKNSFTIPGLGKIVLVQRSARMGRNPMTGASIQIPARKAVKFRVSKIAKDNILGAAK